MRKEIHIVPNVKRGGWDARRENAERASKHIEKKQEAIDWSRNIAKKEGLEMIPHRKDNRIQNPNSYGNDPSSIIDTKH